jgi:hypothetical protein
MKTVEEMTLDELNRLYEELYVAIGPRRMTDRAQALRNVEHARAIARGMKIRQIIDPAEQKDAKGGHLASQRYKHYAELDTVEKFIVTYGEGGHLRLDVQRGNIEIDGEGEKGPLALLP